MSNDLERRTWVYVQPPNTYEIAPCACGKVATQWSEFVGRLWCDECKIDFVPDHNGIFDGPIPVELSKMLGISFDRFNLATGQVEPDPFATTV
jgi:hypothetical protein